MAQHILLFTAARAHILKGVYLLPTSRPSSCSGNSVGQARTTPPSAQVRLYDLLLGIEQPQCGVPVRKIGLEPVHSLLFYIIQQAGNL